MSNKNCKILRPFYITCNTNPPSPTTHFQSWWEYGIFQYTKERKENIEWTPFHFLNQSFSNSGGNVHGEQVIGLWGVWKSCILCTARKFPAKCSVVHRKVILSAEHQRCLNGPHNCTAAKLICSLLRVYLSLDRANY